jgi:selenocysteine-specific elongation factor
VLDEPIALRAGDRFVLRTASPLSTVGGGLVIDPFAPRRGRAWPDAELSAERRLTLALAEAGPAGLLPGALPIRLGLSPEATTELIRGDAAHSLLVGGRLIAREFVARLSDELIAFVSEFHRTRPLDPGVSLQLARSQLAAPTELVDRVIADQTGAGTVEVTAGIIRLAGWIPQPSASQQETIEHIYRTLLAAAHEPPSVGELIETHGPDAESYLRFLERQGRVTQVEPGRYYETRQLESLLNTLASGMRRGQEYAPAELRELLGVSRKYLIPLLEYCDRLGLTSRGTTGRFWRGK